MSASRALKPNRRARLAQLSWKLTLRYTLITVVGLLILELLVLAGPIYQLWTTTLLPEMLTEILKAEAKGSLLHYFATDEPDLAGLDTWQRQVLQNGLTMREGNQVTTLNPEDLDLTQFQIRILDPAGTELAVLGQQGPPTEARRLDTASMPGLERVLAQALAGEQDTGRLYTRTEDDQLTIAVPIKSAAGEVVGLVTATMRLDSGIPFSGLASFFAISLMIFTVGSAIIGVVFGFFAARGLTRRLKHMASTATAWGAGDFSHTIGDSSADEIGQLGLQLNRMAAQLQELLQSRERLSVVEERNRLARELHDSVKQQVFAISMNLGAAQELWEQDPERARGRVDAAFALARQSQQELTTIIQTLRPVALEGKGLQQALRDYVAHWQAQTCIETSCAFGEGMQLPLRVEEELFRVAQEALANVARHSRATAAHVALRADADGVELEVGDNGQGFGDDEAPGIGLASMRERAEGLGGALDIRSDASGTRVRARIPLAH